MDAKKEVFRLLKEHQAKLMRRRKHRVYRLPNGKIFVTGTTQTDERGWRDRLAKLRQLLGVSAPDKGAAPSRRKLGAQKKKKVGAAQVFIGSDTPTEMQSLAEQLEQALAKLKRR